MNTQDSHQIEQEILRRRICTGRELAEALGLSQPSLSRHLRNLPVGRLHRIGVGRRTRYALRRRIEPVGDDWPLYEVTPAGDARTVGTLHALEGGGWHLEQEEVWPVLRGAVFADGLFPDWPWFLDDLRPQGFLGRIFARQFAGEYREPDDPRLWRADQVLRALLREGSDLPGAFVLGEEMLALARSPDQTRWIAPDLRGACYAALAGEVLEGGWPGSSAAGEQPKFTACVADAAGGGRPVIVKFSGDVRDPAQARRADLLVAESIAAGVLARAGIAAAATGILYHDHRCFLESTRFDRAGAAGRIGLVSLQALDSAFHGDLNTPWTAAARRLLRDGLLGGDDAERLCVAWWFGRFIGNSDMHYGNVSFHLSPAAPLALAPIYDMTPMALHPRADGSLPGVLPDVPVAPPEQADFRARAAVLAREYQSRIASDARLSDDFRAICGAAIH